jgi:hypothetical protein
MMRDTAVQASSGEKGGWKSLGWVITRRNSASTKIGSAHRALPSAGAIRRPAAEVVLQQLRAVGVNQDIGIDRDQVRPSMCS